MSVTKSLHARHHKLADTEYQLKVLDTTELLAHDLVKFEQKLEETGLFPLKPTGIEIFQVNVGYMCNQTCAHCHVDAGPDRKEIMTRGHASCVWTHWQKRISKPLISPEVPPEMNPDFRWFVERYRSWAARSWCAVISPSSERIKNITICRNFLQNIKWK
ncbi:MAG: hypothetical protein R2794_10640 [Chitinophagales bacterium]